MTIPRRLAWATTASVILAAAILSAQQGTLTPAEQQRRKDLEAKLQDIAVVERRVMIPMKDGVRLATDIYRPKNAAGKVPIVFVKTPYNFNFWDVRNGVPADMSRDHRRRSSRATPTSARTSAATSSPKATTTSSARRSPTATNRSTG